MSDLTDFPVLSSNPPSPAGTTARTSVKDLQENFTKTSSSLGSVPAPRDSFSVADRKHQFDVGGSSSSSGPGSLTSTSATERSSDFVKLSTVSRRLEDLRKKSSTDFHIGLGKKGAKEEHELMNDVNEEKLDDNDEGEKSINLRDHGLTVGFSSLPDQIYRKSLRKGFNFVVLVIGESGLGKSTLINSLFLTDVYNSGGICNKIEKTREIREHQVQLEENGVKLTLTVVDTPGFGDAVDNRDCWAESLSYVEKQYDRFLEEETRVRRTRLPDNRVHACLYFISPNGHGLKNIDIQCMQKLDKMVNIIPVIGKADACTEEELVTFKERIRNQLDENDIHVYKFPGEEEGEEKAPFAVVGSNVMMEDPVTGRTFRGRKYPWGCVSIEEESHSDFTLLRRLLLCEHTQDLIDTTSSLLYENYRFEKLSKLVSDDDVAKTNKNPLAALEDDVKEHQDKMETMQLEMDEILEKKVQEKNENLDKMTQKEEDIIEKERQVVDLEKAEIFARKAQLDREKVEWATRLRLYSSKSTESLTRKRQFRLSVGNFKFGRQ